ncbi:hypothetical protein MRX96_036429 [Rhipicephalus microplus]
MSSPPLARSCTFFVMCSLVVNHARRFSRLQFPKNRGRRFLPHEEHADEVLAAPFARPVQRKPVLHVGMQEAVGDNVHGLAYVYGRTAGRLRRNQRWQCADLVVHLHAQIGRVAVLLVAALVVQAKAEVHLDPVL